MTKMYLRGRTSAEEKPFPFPEMTYITVDAVGIFSGSNLIMKMFNRSDVMLFCVNKAAFMNSFKLQLTRMTAYYLLGSFSIYLLTSLIL